MMTRSKKRSVMILAAGGVVAASASLAIGLNGGGAPGTASYFEDNALAPATFTALQRQANSTDTAAISAVQSGRGAEILSRVGADETSARVALAGSWGKVILMRTKSPSGDAICIVVRNPEGEGLINCPSTAIIGSGEITLPLWDADGQTVGQVGVVPDGIATVTDVATKDVAEVSNNIYVFEAHPKSPKTLTFTRSDGTSVTRTRLASDGAVTP